MAPTEYNSITSDWARSKTHYSSVTITFVGAITDYDVQANTTLFESITQGRELVLRTTGPISVKFNDAVNDAIDLFSNEGINMTGVSISNIYITSTAAGAVTRVWITGFN